MIVTSEHVDDLKTAAELCVDIARRTRDPSPSMAMIPPFLRDWFLGEVDEPLEQVLLRQHRTFVEMQYHCHNLLWPQRAISPEFHAHFEIAVSVVAISTTYRAVRTIEPEQLPQDILSEARLALELANLAERLHFLDRCTAKCCWTRLRKELPRRCIIPPPALI